LQSGLMVIPEHELAAAPRIDDTFLAGEGVTDFDAYRVDPSQPLSPDFFVPDSSNPPPGVSLAAKGLMLARAAAAIGVKGSVCWKGGPVR